MGLYSYLGGGLDRPRDGGVVRPLLRRIKQPLFSEILRPKPGFSAALSQKGTFVRQTLTLLLDCLQGAPQPL
jgi:hypothetical protein